MREGPLVTVAVIAYNSAEYILETLQSIEEQTYTNLELIISDDGSKDDTVEVCRKWLKTKKDRFVNTCILTVEKNTGVPANANRAVRASHGEWIKIIGGDDLLLPTCVVDYMKGVKASIDVLVGKLQAFYVESTTNEYIDTEILPNKENLFFFELSSTQQYKYLLLHSFNFAPAVFIRRAVFENYGYFNEKFKYFEDLPYWLYLTSQGVKLYLLPNVTVKYRTHHDSLVFSRKYFFNKNFIDCLFRFRKQIVYPVVPYWNFLFYESEGMEYLRYYIIMKFCGNRKNWLSKSIYRFITVLSYRTWYNWLRRYMYR